MGNQNRLLANKYEIECIIGKGGTSTVYKAYDLEAERAVRAVKEVDKSNRAVYEMAKQESSLIKELCGLDKTNSFFPMIIQRFETQTHFYIVQDYLDGVPMNVMLSSGAMDDKVFCSAAKQICSFMEFFHHTGRVYSDMKPENIMVLKFGDTVLDGNSELKLKFIDFGTAIRHKTDPTGYTAEYAAPEQYRLEKLDPRTDVFNIGATFYQMIQGRKPKSVSDGKQLRTSRERFPFDKNINPDIRRVIQKCVADDPAKRYRTCSEIYHDICRIERKNSIRIVAVTAILTVVCLLGGGVLTYAANRKEQANLTAKYNEYVNTGNYAEAIRLDHTNRDGIYIKLIESFKDDIKLDAAEDNFIINEIKACDSIRETDSDYGECMYQIAYAYWLYYNPYQTDDMTNLELEKIRNETAYQWFERAVSSNDLKQNDDHYRKAEILCSACAFAVEIDKMEKEGNDNPAVYTDMWKNLEALSFYIDEENEVVSARVCQTLLSLISRKAARFSRNGVTKSQQMEILTKIQEKVYRGGKITYSNVYAKEIAELFHVEDVKLKLDMAYADEP